MPTPTDMHGVNKNKPGGHHAGLSCNNGMGCPACYAEKLADLLGVCRMDSCSAIQISKDDISACDTDADCVLRTDDCCNCSGATAKGAYAAVSKSGMAEYLANACADFSGVCACPAAPPTFKTRCGSTKHCEVLPIACPVAVPEDGTSCPVKGYCEYGESLIAPCRTYAECLPYGKWTTYLSECDVPSPAGQNGCPSDLSASGSACDPKSDGKICDMGDGAICFCSTCLDGPGPCSELPRWGCATAPDPPCPSVAPNHGQPCGNEGVACNYGVPCSTIGARKLCKGGVWENDLSACTN